MKKYLFALLTITLLTVTPISMDMNASSNDNTTIETRSKTDYA
ncbi:MULTISPECIES: hypothetical protein [Bacillaceae]|nr:MULTISPECIES: hypothetical protein [Bacillaceae]